MVTGIVKWFDAKKGFGFIAPEEGEADCFVHITAVQESGHKVLLENQRVSYEMVEGRNGRMVATDIKILDDQAPATQADDMPEAEADDSSDDSDASNQ